MAPTRRTPAYLPVEHWSDRWEELVLGTAGLNAFKSERERRAAWEANRDWLIAEAADGLPGNRPWAWWRYDADYPNPVSELPENTVGDARRAAEAERLRLMAAAGDLTQAEINAIRTKDKETP